jgi:hypoxanthine phosphoribosyltransferase
VKSGLKVVYTPARISSQVARLGKEISSTYRGRTVDVVVILESAFLFGADLVRRISSPVICHFVRNDVQDVQQGGYVRREIFFSLRPVLKGRDVLLVDTVLETGVTTEFLLRRLWEGEPRSWRLAVLLDKPRERRVDVKPDYFGFAAASNYLVGYGLPGGDGLLRNLPYLAGSRKLDRDNQSSGPGKRRRRNPGGND